MKPTTITIFCTIVIVELFALMFAFAWDSRGFHLQIFGVATVLLTLIAFLIGFVMILIKGTKRIGKGILLASGILLLIGTSVCSIS